MLVPQRQALAKALGMSVEQLAKMVSNQEKVRTLGDAIAEQDGLEKMIGQESMDNMAQIVANLQRVGAELVISIGPTVANLASGIAGFTKGLHKVKILLPMVTGLLGLMLGKSIANFVFSAATALGYSAGFMGPLGLGLILGIPAIIGAMMGTLMQFETGTEIGGIKTDGIVAQLHKGETVLNKKDTEMLATSLNAVRGAGTSDGGKNLTNITEEMRTLTKTTNDTLERVAVALEENISGPRPALARAIAGMTTDGMSTLT